MNPGLELERRMSVPIERVVIQALAHEIRRNLLRLLQTESYSFTELMRIFNVSSGKLNYHLSQIAGFISKNSATEKYELTSLGQKAVKFLDEWHQNLSNTERALLYNAYTFQKTGVNKKKKSFSEFLFVFHEPYLNDLVDRIEDLLKHVPKYDLDYETQSVAINLLRMGFKLNNKAYKERGEILASNLPPKLLLKVYQRTGELLLKNNPNNSQGLEYFQKAFEEWKKDIQSRKLTSDYWDNLKLLEALKENQMIDLLQIGKELLLEQLLNTQTLEMSYSQSKFIAQLARIMIGIETKEQIVSYFSLAEEMITTTFQQPEYILARGITDFHHGYGGTGIKNLNQVIHTEHYTLADLQFVLAKATKDIDGLNLLLRACELTDPFFIVVHKVLIAKAYYELKEENRAYSILTEICDYLVTKFENRESDDFFTISPAGFDLLLDDATKVAEICYSLQMLNYVKQLLPLLKYQDEDLHLRGVAYDPIPLLIQVGEYTQRNLQSELDQIKKELTNLQPREEVTYSSFEDFFSSMLPESSDSRKPIISPPAKVKLFQELSQLQQYANQLGVDAITAEIEDLKQQWFQSIIERQKLIEDYQKKYPAKRDHEFVHFLPLVPGEITTFKPSEAKISRIKPEKIIQAYEMGDITKTEALLHQYEEMLDEDESDKPHTLGKNGTYIPPSNRRETIWKSTKKIKLARICLKVQRLKKAKNLLTEVQQDLAQMKNFKQFQGVNPTCSPLGLYRQAIHLKVQCGCSLAELDDLIAFTRKNDPKGLPFLGLAFVENGLVEKALEILETRLTPSRKLNFTPYHLRRYFETKMEVLAELGELTEAEEIRKKIEASILEKDSPSYPADIMTGHVLQEALLSSNLDHVRSAIDECVPDVLSSGDFLNDFDRLHFEPLKPLLQKTPLKGVNEEFRKEAQTILCEILLDILEQSTSISGIGNTGIIRVLFLLLDFDRHKEVKKYLEYFFSMLQEALEKYAPSELKKDLSLIPLDTSPWSYENTLQMDLTRTKFRFLAQIDFWSCFQETDANPPLNYYQFDATYQRWYRESQSGDMKNSFLFVNIPLSYMYALPICAKLEETKLISVCAKNMTVLQKKRHNIVTKEPIIDIHDQDWYSNIFSNISQQMRALLQRGDYETAKECLGHALDLLYYDGVSVPDHIGKILRIFGMITEY